MDLEIFWVAIQNLRREGMRTYLTLIGVIIGIAAIVALLSIGEGLNYAVAQQFEKLGTETIYITMASVNPRESIAAARSDIGLKDADLARINSFPEIDEVLPLYISSAEIKHGNETIRASIYAADPKKADFLKDAGLMEIKEGRNYEEKDIFSVIIGGQLAEEGFTRELHPRTTLNIKGKKFKVVGVIDRKSQGFGSDSQGSSGSVFTTEKAFKQLFGINQTPITVIAKATSANVVDTAVEKIKRYLDRWYGEKAFTVLSSQQVLEQFNQILGIISVFLLGIAAISLLVGSVGIMNAMVTNVIERTTEIGLMKAIGATNNLILTMFLIEAGLIGLIGGAIGFLLGMGISNLVAIIGQASGFPLQAIIAPQTTLGVLLFSMIIGMISGFYPAYRAAKLDPVEALRRE